MSGEERSVGDRVLALLERGETEEARALLAGFSGTDAEHAGGPEAGGPEAGGPQEGGREAELLLRLLTPPHEVQPPARRFAAEGPTTPREAVLRHLLEGRVALAAGRLDDLTRHATEAATAPRDEPWLRLRAASLAQAAYRFTGDAEHLARGLDLAGEVADRMDLPHLAVTARSVRATLHLLTGALYQVEESCRAAIELARASGLERHPSVAMAHQFLGYALLEWNRLDDARVELETAWVLAGRQARSIRSGVARVMTEVALAQRDDREAESWFERLQGEVTEPMTLRNREWLAAVRARRGPSDAHDLRVLDAWRQRYDYRSETLAALPDREAASRLHELDHLLGALEATRQWPDVPVVADTILRGAGPGRAWFGARAHAARAVALEAAGRSGAADVAFAEALALGRSGGLTRTYTDGSPLRARLLVRASERPETRADAERVLVAGGDAHAEPAVRLTPRQLEVLGHVAAGLSNRDAAAALGLGETTVRTHLREVYARLGVGSRTAAVAEARRLQLLPEGRP